jgi:hypothetical protein
VWWLIKLEAHGHTNKSLLPPPLLPLREFNRLKKRGKHDVIEKFMDLLIVGLDFSFFMYKHTSGCIQPNIVINIQ